MRLCEIAERVAASFQAARLNEPGNRGVLVCQHRICVTNADTCRGGDGGRIQRGIGKSPFYG